MNTAILILICFACAIGGAGLLEIAYLLLPFKKTKQNFSDEQEAVIKGLTKKKDSYEKEITAEIQNNIREIKEEEKNLKEHFEEKQFQHDRAIEELEIHYKKKQDALNALEEAAAKERHNDLSKKIADEQAAATVELGKIQQDYKDKKDEIENDFFQFSEQINSQRATLEEELRQYQQQQKEVIARFKKDEEIRQQRDFYHITITENAKRDIKKLKDLALEFSKPEALYKVIYDVYYKSKVEELFDRVLGDNKDKGGIYKITNINNEKAYVGRTINFKNRFKEHVKRGCGLDVINGRIYDVMFNEGIENFSFEVIEVCDRSEQAAKEKYWINFYGTLSYGYNSRQGG